MVRRKPRFREALRLRFRRRRAMSFEGHACRFHTGNREPKRSVAAFHRIEFLLQRGIERAARVREFQREIPIEISETRSFERGGHFRISGHSAEPRVSQLFEHGNDRFRTTARDRIHREKRVRLRTDRGNLKHPPTNKKTASSATCRYFFSSILRRSS